MSQVKLAARFAKADQPLNGFTESEFVDEILRNHGGEGYGVFRWTTRRITDELEDGVRVPSFAFVALEPLSGDQADAAKELLAERYKERTGRTIGSDEPDPTLFDGPDDDGEGTGSAVQRDDWLDK